MNNEPVAWMQSTNKELPDGYECMQSVGFYKVNDDDIPLYTHPAKTPAKQRYDDCMKDCDEPNPIERLRFFLSCALTGQDWLDVEPFIDDITHPAKTLTDEEIKTIYYETGDLFDFARAILRKVQGK